MKLKKVLLACLMLIVLSTTIVFATEADVPVTTSLDSEVMPISENIAEEIQVEENDYFVCEENITLSNLKVLGNLFVVGSTIQMTDVHVEGSIFAVSEKIDLSNVYANGSLYAVGANIVTKSSTLKNIYTVSAGIDVLEGTNIEKNFYSVSENCNFNAIVNNDVGIVGKEVNIGNESAVEGSLNIAASKEPEISSDMNIENYKFELLEQEEKNVKTTIDFKTRVLQIIGYVASTVVIAVFVLKYASSTKDKIENYEIANCVKNALIGLVLVIAVPVISILAMCTGIGIRLGFVLLFIYIIALMIATPLACVVISLIIAKKKNIIEFKNIILCTAIVSLIVAVIGSIFILNVLIPIVLGLIGFGTMFVLPFTNISEVKE